MDRYSLLVRLLPPLLHAKTKEFGIRTRSYTADHVLASSDELTEIALNLRDRVDLGPQQSYRLVDVGLSNFRDAEDDEAQPALFE